MDRVVTLDEAALTPSALPERVDRRRVVVMLTHRLVGFALFQAVIAVGFLLLGRSDWWGASVAWWPVGAIATNVVTITLLITSFRREGGSFRALFEIDRSRVGKDLGIVAGLAVAAAVLAVGPNLGLAALLFGDAEAPLATFIQPLPTAVAVGVVVLFPATIALSELAAYFGYVRPRLEALTGRPWSAIGLAAGFLALQHATLPLVFDWRFVAWRALMFLPFALMVGIVLRWRPRLLAYLAVLHGLADLQVAVMILVEST